MKVLLVNGSPNKKGCTYTALCEVEKELNKFNIETEIFPANINQRAVIVPPGDNIIEFYYVARSFLWGVVILVVSIIIFLFFSLLHR